MSLSLLKKISMPTPPPFGTHKGLTFIKIILMSTMLCVPTIFTYADSHQYLVVQNQYFPKVGKEQAVYQLRRQASQILLKLGVPKGRVLKRKNLSDRPYVMWECDYLSQAARKKAIAIVRSSAEFKQVMKRMGSLVSDFKRIEWQVEE